MSKREKKFYCEFCDYETEIEKGLNIHKGLKHGTKKEREEEHKKEKENLITINSPVAKDEQIVVASELADDEMIEQELAGEVLPHYVYKFKNRGREVTGLTVKGVNEVVRKLNRKRDSGVNIRLKPEYMRIERNVKYGSEEGVEVSVFAENLVDGNSAWGIKFEPYKIPTTGGKTINNKFAIEKALSKAERNAKKKLIPAQAATAMINQIIEGNPDRVKSLKPAKKSQKTYKANRASKTPTDRLQEVVRSAVNNATTKKKLDDLKEGVKKSKKFSGEFKEDILSEIEDKKRIIASEK